MNQYLVTQLQEHFTSEQEEKEKVSFWPSESETMLFDIYHKWIGTPPTNPIEAEKLVMFEAAKMMELALVKRLQKLGIAEEGEEQERIENHTYPAPITGYMDGLLKDNVPLEVKSFYGDYQAKELDAGKPRPSYLKQLAIYMDCKNATKGKLVYINRGTGKMYEFTLTRENEETLNFKCLNVKFNLNDTYERWMDLYTNHIVPKIPPKPDYRYKIPVNEVDWKSLSKSDITKARNNRKVVGDHPWAVQYSPYKNLIIKEEGTTPGYTDEELAIIKELTTGFTNW